MIVNTIRLLSLLFCSFVNCAPEQIILNYGKDSTEMVVTWADNNSYNGECIFGTSSESLTVVVEASKNQYTMSAYTSPYLYKAVITGIIDM